MGNRFEIVDRQYLGEVGEAGVSMIITRDKETGIMYLFNRVGPTGGLTPLLDKDGNPVRTFICQECGFELSKDMKVCPECGCPIDF